jgi:hypothetical protein
VCFRDDVVELLGVDFSARRPARLMWFVRHRKASSV